MKEGHCYKRGLAGRGQISIFISSVDDKMNSCKT